MKNSREEIMRGHFDECWQFFCQKFESNYPKGSHRGNEAKETIAKFCKVSVKTVRSWLNGLHPNGEELIRLNCFLESQGYRIIELNRLPKARLNFLLLIGYDLMTVEFATNLVGFKNKSELFRVLHGKINTSEEKDAIMWDAWKERRDQLEVKMDNVALLINQTKEVKTVATKPAITAKSAALPILSPITIKVADLLLHMLEGNLQAPIEVNQQHEAVKTLLQLSAKLSALSSQLISNEPKGE